HGVAAAVVGDEPAGDSSGKRRRVDSIPNRGLALADDRVADVAEVALTLGRNAATPLTRGAGARFGEVGCLRRKRGRHTGPPLRPPGATAMASPICYPALCRIASPGGHRCRRVLFDWAGWRARRRVQALSATRDAAPYLVHACGHVKDNSGPIRKLLTPGMTGRGSANWRCRQCAPSCYGLPRAA